MKPRANTMDYVRGGTFPRKLRPGMRLVHNHVRPEGFHPNYPIGMWGFRAWWTTTKAGRLDKRQRLVQCQCGWAPEVPRHYRISVSSQ
jgi:hypothetical protein